MLSESCDTGFYLTKRRRFWNGNLDGGIIPSLFTVSSHFGIMDVESTVLSRLT
jgi:hypothetical protein